MAMMKKRELDYATLMAKVDLPNDGWGFDEFEEKYGYSEDELIAHIRDNLCKRETWARRIIKRIRKNTERRRSAATKLAAETEAAESAPATADATDETVNPSMVEELSEPTEDTSDAMDGVEARGPEANITEQLAGLQQQETEQREKVISLERRHAELASKQRETPGELEKLAEQLANIERSYLARKADYEALVAKNNELLEQINSVSQERRKQAAILEEIRAEIAELQAITLWVYADGTIEVDRPTFELDDSDYEALFVELVAKDELQGLRVMDIRVLARLLRIVEHADIDVSFFFEMEDLEQAFAGLAPVA